MIEDPATLKGAHVPWRVWMAGNPADGYEFTLDSSKGTWYNNEAWLPQSVKDEYSVTGEDWGILQASNGALWVVKHVSDTSFTPVYTFPELDKDWGFDHPWLQSAFGNPGTGIRLNEGGEITVKQLVVFAGSFKDLVMRFFYSTGKADYNEDTNGWDDFDFQFGASIPYDLLGTDFELSIDNLVAASMSNAMVVVLEKPTKLWEVLAPEIILRGAWLVWKDGGLRFVSPTTPNSSTAVHTWTENTKASAEIEDKQRTISQKTSQYLRNVFKLEYNRSAVIGGTYRNTVEVRFQSSIDDYGASKPVTIRCRNTYGDWATTGSAIVELAGEFLARVAPLYGKPLRIMKRPIGHQYYESCVPGDVVTITDSHARSPSDGSRGLTAKPAVILRHSHGWGGAGEDMYGEAWCLFQNLDRATIYSPTAQVDHTMNAGNYDAGYDSTAEKIYCLDHEHSEASEDEDWTHFQDGDLITILEIDPSNPALADSYNDTVNGTPAANEIALTTGGHGGWDNTKKHRVVSRTYSSAQSTQKSDAYLADDGDGLIENVAPAYEYADAYSDIAWTDAAATELPERHVDIMSDEGQPVATAYSRAIARNLNNFISYASGCQMGWLVTGGTVVAGGTGGAAAYELEYCYPYYIGPQLAIGVSRTVSVAPMFYSSNNGDTVYCRITLSRTPPTGTSLTSVTFTPPYKQETWSTSSGTNALATAATIAPVTTIDGWGWCSVEMAGAGGHAATVRFWGVPQFYLGPLVLP
jgi:hypothetical protein